MAEEGKEKVGKAEVRPGAGLCCLCQDSAFVLEGQGVENFEQEPFVYIKSIIMWTASWRIERPEVARRRPGGGCNKA